MDEDLIRQKLESLRRCVLRVREKCPADAATLERDPDLQDIVTLNLSRAIQLCVDIGAHLIAEVDVPAPVTMGQTFDGLARVGVLTPDLARKLRRAVGFRNIVVHNYEAIDWQVVHALADSHLSDFTDYARAVMAYLGKSAGRA
jgi:uncharacterized protein YutE (UPF0331/DUF86 family)